MVDNPAECSVASAVIAVLSLAFDIAGQITLRGQLQMQSLNDTRRNSRCSHKVSAMHLHLSNQSCGAVQVARLHLYYWTYHVAACLSTTVAARSGAVVGT